jgi:hypothetical protein
MMKRTLIGVLLVLAMTSWVAAAPIFQIENPKASYGEGVTVAIDLIDPGEGGAGGSPIIGVEIDAITDNLSGDAYGSIVPQTGINPDLTDGALLKASVPAVYNTIIAYGYPNYSMPPLYLSLGIDFDDSTNTGTTGKLGTFDYVTPSTPGSYFVQTDSSGFHTIISYKSGDTYTVGQGGAQDFGVTVNVIPEPATMLLLGLGGLLLRRRK